MSSPLEPTLIGSVPEQPAFVDFRFAELYLGGVSRSHVKKLLNRGELTSVKIGRRRVIVYESLLDFVRRQQAC